MMHFPIAQGRPWLALGLSLALSACTATEQTAETAAPTSVPTAVNSDADRRAIYNSNGTGTVGGRELPDATPNRVRLGEQAASINSQKRIENVNTNDPNNTTPETRIQRLNYDAPVDTARRRP